MEPWLDDGDCVLYLGDCLTVLRELPSASVDCCVTSPPYFGLRDYGEDAQVGLESTTEAYVERLTEIFQEVRRVLADHGTLWLNLGDSHIAKQLQGVPWRTALSLQADGWYLRSDCIWSKPNAMPSSVTDRPTTDHEYVFLLTKRSSYYFDAEAVREPYSTLHSRSRKTMEGPTLGDLPPESPRGPDGRRRTSVQSGAKSIQYRDGERWPNPAGRNIRTVWEIVTEPYQGAHFAVFPGELVRRAILAGCPQHVCRQCGKPRERIVEVGELAGEAKIQTGPRPAADERGTSASSMARTNGRTWRERHDLGFTDCGHDDYRAGIVLDPFHGSGTTSLIARNHSRRAIGIELNEDYCRMAAERLQQLSLLSQ